LYVWRNVVQVATSYPVDVFADRYGPTRVLIIGYMLGVSTAVLTVLAFALNVANVTVLATIFFVGGFYVTVQEALEPAVTASMVDADRLAMSYGALGVVNGTAKFASSAAVGVLWTAASPVIGFGTAAVLMAAGTIALIRARLGVARTSELACPAEPMAWIVVQRWGQLLRSVRRAGDSGEGRVTPFSPDVSDHQDRLQQSLVGAPAAQLLEALFPACQQGVASDVLNLRLCPTTWTAGRPRG
jgi:MFS family permease